MNNVQWKRFTIGYGQVIVIEAYCPVCKFGSQWSGRNVSSFPGYRHCGRLEPVPQDIIPTTPEAKVQAAQAPAREPGKISWV